MTKCRKMLSLAVVALLGGLLTVAVVSWRHAARTPSFRFLSGQRRLWHGPSVRYEGVVVPGQHITMDIYSWPADFGGLCTEAGKELSRASFRNVSYLEEREFFQPGLRPIRVIISRGKFEEGESKTTFGVSETPGWVVVMVEQNRPSLWQSLSALLRRLRRPSPRSKAYSLEITSPWGLFPCPPCLATAE
jgi:hypothetical protein